MVNKGFCARFTLSELSLKFVELQQNLIWHCGVDVAPSDVFGWKSRLSIASLRLKIGPRL